MTLVLSAIGLLHPLQHANFPRRTPVCLIREQ